MSNNRQTRKEGRGWPFSGGCSFYIKNKLESEIFNGKKFIKKMFFSVITKNLNLEISTKNLVMFKRWDGVKDETFKFEKLEFTDK